MNTANKLTLFRIALVPVFLVFMLTDSIPYSRLIACGVFCLATLTDKLDGTIARKYNMVTNFGKFMDPIADKLLVTSALICLTASGELPAWATVTIVAREFVISGVRLVASEAGVTVAASFWGKAKTVSQMVMIIIMLANISFLQVVEKPILYISLALTVISGIDYIIKNRKVILAGEK